MTSRRHLASYRGTFIGPNLLLRIAAAAIILGLTYASSAQAFCRVTTSIPERPAAEETTCEDGRPLFWASPCIAFGIDRKGSPRLNITFKDMHKVLETSLEVWSKADCGSTALALRPINRGALDCAQSEFVANAPASNNNLITFIDQSWPFGDTESRYALTTLTFDKHTGEILDADIEVNSAALNASPQASRSRQLESILTHELGHAFGLGHSTFSDSVMDPYQAFDRIEEQAPPPVLAEDDVRAICSVFGSNETARCQTEVAGQDFTRHCAEPARLQGNCTSTSAPAPHSESLPTWGGLLIAVLSLLVGRRWRSYLV